jgi:hypothetical protein
LNTILDIGMEEILPGARAILTQQGVPEQATGIEELLTLAEMARGELAAALAPAGVLNEVSVGEFAEIYPGQGFNDPDTPLEPIYMRAERLALFAVTCGQAVCDRISNLFLANDYPLGAALDAGASLAADRAAQVAQDKFASTLDDKSGVLRYSPGYCGWHVSGQKALFNFLDSEPAGITLTDSSLMRPIKSVSGVIVAGRPDIHSFTNDYKFCTSCTGKECRERVLSVLAPPEKEA